MKTVVCGASPTGLPTFGGKKEELGISIGAEARLGNPKANHNSYFLNLNFSAPEAQRIEHRASNAEVAGEIPAGSTTQDFPGVAQRRGNELRPRSVRVQVLPPGPLSLP